MLSYARAHHHHIGAGHRTTATKALGKTKTFLHQCCEFTNTAPLLPQDLTSPGRSGRFRYMFQCKVLSYASEFFGDL